MDMAGASAGMGRVASDIGAAEIGCGSTIPVHASHTIDAEKNRFMVFTCFLACAMKQLARFLPLKKGRPILGMAFLRSPRLQIPATLTHLGTYRRRIARLILCLAKANPAD